MHCSAQVQSVMEDAFHSDKMKVEENFITLQNGLVGAKFDSKTGYLRVSHSIMIFYSQITVSLK